MIPCPTPAHLPRQRSSKSYRGNGFSNVGYCPRSAVWGSVFGPSSHATTRAPTPVSGRARTRQWPVRHSPGAPKRPCCTPLVRHLLTCSIHTPPTRLRTAAGQIHGNAGSASADDTEATSAPPRPVRRPTDGSTPGSNAEPNLSCRIGRLFPIDVKSALFDHGTTFHLALRARGLCQSVKNLTQRPGCLRNVAGRGRSGDRFCKPYRGFGRSLMPVGPIFAKVVPHGDHNLQA